MHLEGADAEQQEGGHEKYHARVLLRFMRHAEKAGGNDVPEDIDHAMPLTEQGREHAMQRGRDFLEGRTKVLAAGGPRKRTKETALRSIVGTNPRVRIDQTFEELLAERDEDGIPYSDRMWENHLLDAPFVKGTPLHEELNQAYEEGRYMSAIIAKHQEIQAGSRELDVYALQALHIAKIVRRWAGLSTTLAERSAYHEGHVPDSEKELKRIFSTHGGIFESFLTEVIKRTEGESESTRFTTAFPNGIDYAEGFDIEIIGTASEDPHIHIRANLGPVDHRYVVDKEIPLSAIESITTDFAPAESNT